MAIEDAEALGYLFRDMTLPISASASASASEITKQLAIFQSLRMKRAHYVQFKSRHIGNLLKGKLKEEAGEYDSAARGAFAKALYGYTGFEAVYKAHLAEGK
jgi:salicylate hydroxylase